MSKDDIPPLPSRVPTKRRHLEALLDVHIATWLATGNLSSLEREYLEQEKERRQLAKKVFILRLGLVVAVEGVTPHQQESILFLLRKDEPTHIIHHRLPSRLHQACRKVTKEVVVMSSGSYADRTRAVVRVSQALIAAPKELHEPRGHKEDGTVWSGIKYARHRGIPVQIVLPTGELIE